MVKRIKILGVSNPPPAQLNKYAISRPLPCGGAGGRKCREDSGNVAVMRR